MPGRDAGPRRIVRRKLGKAGVSYEEYRADAVECGKRGYFRDVSKDEPTKRFITGFNRADNDLNKQSALPPPTQRDWNETILRTNPEKQKRKLHRIQVNDVERCLIDKGYSQFRLNREQERKLKTYRVGSEERHRYLYGIGTQAAE